MLKNIYTLPNYIPLLLGSGYYEKYIVRCLWKCTLFRGQSVDPFCLLTSQKAYRTGTWYYTLSVELYYMSLYTILYQSSYTIWVCITCTPVIQVACINTRNYLWEILQRVEKYLNLMIKKLLLSFLWSGRKIIWFWHLMYLFNVLMHFFIYFKIDIAEFISQLNYYYYLTGKYSCVLYRHSVHTIIGISSNSATEALNGQSIN